MTDKSSCDVLMIFSFVTSIVLFAQEGVKFDPQHNLKCELLYLKINSKLFSWETIVWAVNMLLLLLLFLL